MAKRKGQARSQSRSLAGGSRIAVGIHACVEALRADKNQIIQAYVRRDSGHRLKDCIQELELSGLKYQEVEQKRLDRFAPQNQGIAMELLPAKKFSLEDMENADEGLFLGLDGIEDPHNLGAILRTAWLMGVKGVILTEHSSVGLTPAVHKVACGGVEYVPTLNINKFSDLTGRLKDSGFWIYGLAGEANTSIFQYKPAAKTLLLVGAEEKGLRQTTRNLCDELVSLPQIKASASYNASVAAAIAMAETQRQREEMMKRF